jgi:hypothetical protein
VTGQQSKGARVTRRPASAHHPKSDDRKVMIERVGKPYSRPLHDREAGGIDGGQFVQVSAPEIFPRSLQIAKVAGKDVESARPGYRILPRQRHIPAQHRPKGPLLARPAQVITWYFGRPRI